MQLNTPDSWGLAEDIIKGPNVYLKKEKLSPLNSVFGFKIHSEKTTLNVRIYSNNCYFHILSIWGNELELFKFNYRINIDVGDEILIRNVLEKRNFW